MRLAAWLATAALIAGCANAAVGVALTFGAIDYVNNPQPLPDPSAFFVSDPPAPVLAPNRRITEQDCSKPIDLAQGNLRCK
jgi:hypothetical protein